ITTADATVNSDYYTIGGTITADTNNVTIQVLKGSDVVGTVIITAGDTAWSVVVPLAQTVANTFTARATDPSGNSALSTANADPLLQSVVITESATAGADLAAPAGLAITTADATVNSDYYTIGGTITADANDVTIQVLKGSDVVGTVIITAGETTWSVVVPLAQTVANTFTARATDPSGNSALSTANADPLLQSVVITESATAGADLAAPAGLAITTADATVNSDYYTIGGTITADTNNVTIQVLKGSDVVGTVIITAGETAWSVVVPLAQTVANTFTARATDPSGNSALSTANADPLLQSVVITESATAGMDITAPVITDQAPDVGETDVSINPEDLYVQFDEALDPTTIGSSNVMLCLVSDATCATPVTVGSPMLMENGTMIRVGGPSVTLSYNTAYWIKITTGVKNLAGIALAAPYGSTTTSNFTTATAPTGSLSVDNIRINPAKSYAVNDNDFDHGWEWYVSLTIPITDGKVRLKFSDFAGSVGSIPATGDNIRYYSADDTNGHTTENTAVNIATVDTYPADYLIFNGGSDEEPDMPGYQVVVKVQVKVPVVATGGSYAGQFKVEATH
ncbi:MAG: Ig-like domain-containing protein, partial [Candidatus Pacebacteria bacterium]|nr:Ig-like domain-containing protein [Candidatus Paceibacterota bacterium]